MIDLLLYVCVLAVALGGVALNVVSLPGNWLMFFSAVGLAAWHGWAKPSWLAILIMLVILVAAEVAEFFSGVVGARKFGASKGAAWAAIAGAFIGGIVGTPVPVIGNLVGAVVGAFLAALVIELLQERPIPVAARGATGAAIGRAAGIFVKITCGMLAWVVLAVSALPWF